MNKLKFLGWVTLFLLLVFFLSSKTFLVQSQGEQSIYLPIIKDVPDITGVWSGFLTQVPSPDGITFPPSFGFGLSLKQNGGNIQGTSTIHDFIHDHYAIMSLSGSLIGNTAYLDEIEVIDTNAPPGSGFYWCIKSMDLTFSTYQEKSLLIGNWEDQDCNSGAIQLQLSTDSFVSIEGLWEGTLTQPGTNFSFGLSLDQASGSINGTSTIQNGSEYATMELVGFVVGDFILLQETHIIDNSGSDWCIKTIELAYSDGDGGQQLDGEWNDLGCGSGTVSLLK